LLSAGVPGEWQSGECPFRQRGLCSSVIRQGLGFGYSGQNDLPNTPSLDDRQKKAREVRARGLLPF